MRPIRSEFAAHQYLSTLEVKPNAFRPVAQTRKPASHVDMGALWGCLLAIVGAPSLALLVMSFR